MRERMRERYAKLQEEADAKAAYWKPKQGDNIIRILPSWTGNPDADFIQPIFVHWFDRVDDGGGKRGKFGCPKKMAGRDCALCDIVSRLFDSGAPEDAQLARELNAPRKFLVNIVDAHDADAGAQVWEFGPRLYELLLFNLTDEECGVNYVDPKEGYNIKVERSGEKLQTKYSLGISRRPSAIPAAWLEGLPDLSKIVHVPTDSEVAQIIGTMALPRGLVDSDPPVSSRRAGAGAGRSDTRASGRGAGKASRAADEALDESFDPNDFE